MIKKISVLAGVAAIPFILGGCGSTDESSITLQNVQGLNVKFSDNSADLTDRPFYFMGTKSVVGINGTYNGVASPVTMPATTTKDLSKVTLTFTGSIVGSTATLPEFYKLEIRARDLNGAAPAAGVEKPGYTQDLVYSVGFAKDVNNTLFAFAPDAAGPVNATAANKADVYITSLAPLRTGPILDFTVNIPTVSGTAVAPYTGTTGTTAQELGTLVTDVAIKSDGGRSQLSTSTIAVDSKYSITVPWALETSSTYAINSSGVIAQTFVYPVAYWKSGMGPVESVARYYWLQNNTGVAAAANTYGSKISGANASDNSVFKAFDYSVNAVDPNKLVFTAPATATPQPTSTLFGPYETGFFDPATKMPRGTN